MNLKIKLFSPAIIAIIALVSTSCSKDDKVPLDAALGTYKGSMTTYPPNSPLQIFDNTTVTVTSAGEGQLKVTPASNTKASARTFLVFTEDGGIYNSEDDSKGIFIYDDETDELIVNTSRTNPKETGFRFKGLKQPKFEPHQ
ncbi:hypothetical protein [Sphingobacterium cellulitidis]|uniref:Lipocalin-like domain-containing protein n=1 Tax=Sphingobacterium cellulitidis TaxID=1768011 RepID=A0A8H9FZN6_9SPHI|nr:hypothetical protein [Sphingobacterium soli]MBA8986427.1 hypothetical protein [Sphingobacterium soli]GGE20147.1 hypothetical protein GCM10011516_17250 [Sphingobacterium soli]